MIPERETPHLSGAEPLRHRGRPLAEDVLSFWKWSSSELLGNALRGRFAEYVVAIATDADSPHREEWDVFDLETPDGTTVEVKSASYLQSWEQTTHSKIDFDIAPKLEWDDAAGVHGSERVRAADVYVFCLLGHRDMATVEPLELEQWRFHVLPTFVLDEERPGQKKITLGSLLSLGPDVCGFRELGERVRVAGERAVEAADPGLRSPATKVRRTNRPTG